MIITGFTDSRLNEVKTYDDNNPYVVGVNGVTNVVYETTYGIDSSGNTLTEQSLSSVEYEINGIKYTTNILNPLFPDSNLFFKTQTVYFFESSGLTVQNINLIKREAEMGISFPPKVENQIFIERQSISVFERHLRLEDIESIDQFDTYRNGYYNIFNIE